MYLFDGAPIKNGAKHVCLLVMFMMSTTYFYVHFMRFELLHAKMGLGTQPQYNNSMRAFACIFTTDLMANDCRVFD